MYLPGGVQDDAEYFYIAWFLLFLTGGVHDDDESYFYIAWFFRGRWSIITHRTPPPFLLHHLLLLLSTPMDMCIQKRDDYAYAIVNSSPSIRPPRTQETQSHM